MPELTTTNYVKYTGEDVPLLGISNGDTMTEVEAAVTSKIVELIAGTGMDLSSLTYDCTFITDELAGEDKNAATVIQALLTGQCTLKSLIDELTEIVNTPVTYDRKCLDTTASTTPEIVQALIDLVCPLVEDVAAISDQLTDNDLTETIQNEIGNFLYNNVSSKGSYGLTKTGSGKNVELVFALFPPYTPVFSFAPMSYWNSDGTGKSGTAFEGWVICDGQNSVAKDMRGYAPVGATNLPGINSPTLDERVSGTLTNVGEKAGEVKHQLSTNELPAHTHPSGENGDISTEAVVYNFGVKAGSGAQALCKFPFNGEIGVDTLQATGTSSTGTTGETGLGQPFENRQPSIHGYFIMRLP